MNILTLLVVVTIGLVVIIIIVHLLTRKPPVAGPCGLVVRPIAKDYCGGACGPGTSCTATATKPYAVFFTQDAACACLPAIPGAAGPPPGAGPGPGGGGPAGAGVGGSGADGIAPVGESTHTGSGQ